MASTSAAFAVLPGCAWARGSATRAPLGALRAARTHVVARRARGGARMSSDEAEDEAPSDSAMPPSAASVGMPTSVTDVLDAPERASTLSSLLRLCAATGRGQLASDGQRAAIDDLVARLEELSPSSEPVNSPGFDGVWVLLYTDARLFKTNPLLAAAVTPLLEVGQVRQTVDVGGGTLSTEVDVVAFPATSATLRTTARVTPVGAERVEFVVEKTSVTGGKIAGKLDLGGLAFDVPVESIYSRIRGAAPETYFDTYYLDGSVRVSRSKSGSVYIYAKE